MTQLNIKRNKFLFSIIIPSHLRLSKLKKIIFSLSKQICINFNFEIIICNNNYNNFHKIVNFTRNFKKLSCKYLNCEINHQGFKRNKGFNVSKGKYIIFIDDDCIPEKKFLYNYYQILNLGRKKIIYCGAVNYITYSKVKNLINYRQSRLFLKNKNLILKPKNIVTMNMCLEKNLFKKKSIFDNKFRFYGFEDYEFAFRNKHYFIYQSCKPLVFHDDDRGFEDFLRKYEYLAMFAFPELLKINPEAAKNIIYFKIENSLLLKLFLLFPGISLILNVTKLIFLRFENLSNYCSYLFYTPAILNAYLIGILKRKKYYKNNLKEKSILSFKKWYK